jgi:antiviral helicase SLH1
MMSPSFSTAESQWLAQLAAMREAIAEVKLDQSTSQLQKYGQDIVMDDGDLSGESSDEIWDIFGEDDINGCSSSVPNDQAESEPNIDGEYSGYDLEWLREKCRALTYHNSSGLETNHLQDQLLALLVSDMQSKSSSSCIGFH